MIGDQCGIAKFYICKSAIIKLLILNIIWLKVHSREPRSAYTIQLIYLLSSLCLYFTPYFANTFDWVLVTPVTVTAHRLNIIFNSVAVTVNVNRFIGLIQREWLDGGHPFSLRNGHTSLSTKKDQAPVFLLFLDCVYQVNIILYACKFSRDVKFHEFHE